MILYLWIVMHIHWGKALNALENQHHSSLNMCILTLLLIFAFWSFLMPFFKLKHANGPVGALSMLVNLWLWLNFCPWLDAFSRYVKTLRELWTVWCCNIEWSLWCNIEGGGGTNSFDWSKIAFGEGVFWLSFKWCIEFLWMGDFIF